MRQDSVRNFTPAELGINAVNATVVAITTGNTISLEPYEQFLLVITGTGTMPTVHLSWQALDATATFFATYVLVPFGTNPPYQLINPSCFQWGPGGGSMFGGTTGANPFGDGARSSNPYPLRGGRFVFQITVAGTGTCSANLFAR